MGLLSVVLIITACCFSIASAEGIVQTKQPKKKLSTVIKNDSDVKRYLKASNTIVTKEARTSLSDVTSLKTLLQKIPYYENVKKLLQKKPDVAKSATDTSSKKVTDQGNKGYKEVTKLEAWKIVIKGQLKSMAIIAAIALIGGYIAYLVNG